VSLPQVFAMTLPDDRILVGNAQCERLHPHGAWDSNFAPDDTTRTGIVMVATQPDGKCIVGGVFTNFSGFPRQYLARLNIDGSVDTSFDPGLGPTTEEPHYQWLFNGTNLDNATNAVKAVRMVAAREPLNVYLGGRPFC
jgi:hypothetical protein